MAVVLPIPPLSCFDIRYEFCAPHFFDFCVVETEEQVRAVEKWFEIAAGYEPSPCPLSEAKQDQVTHPDRDENLRLKLLIRLDNQATEATATTTSLEVDLSTPKENEFIVSTDPDRNEVLEDSARMQPGLTADFPAKRLREPPVAKKQMKRHTHDATKKKKVIAKQQPAPTPQGNSCKRRKLDGGQKQAQAHKYTPAPTVPRAFQLSTNKRAQMHKKGEYESVSKMGDLSTFVSVAEQVQRFYLRTPARSHKQNKPKLTLSKPKDPELETSYRSRPPRVKSAAELEEEILSQMPKFKARPANKKILEAPTLPALPRSTPELPQFQEFNLKTNERAMQHTSQKCVVQPLNLSTKKKKERRKSAPGHISIRSRPRIKTTEELVHDELAKVPKFKALPLNKKIFESRGDLGLYRQQKRQVTVPVEFHFATKERCHREQDFRRLSLDSHPRPIRGKTKAKPFHLLTEERGSAKTEKFMQELSKEMTSETLSRIPKANLMPFTTDFPIVPAKPAQKPCTRPEPFRLESLTRHEQEVQRLAEDRARADKQRAEVSRFRAQPISCSGAVFVPERSRKPLTEIKEFNLKVDNRATQRAAFEKKIVEKQSMYKQLKEELELARKEEGERFVRALRSEMIPQARPVPLFDRPFTTQRSSKSLTLPISPQFSLPRKHHGDVAAPFTYRKYRMR